MEPTRQIARVWEVDWALPPGEGGVQWASYGWTLERAAELAAPLQVVGSTYASLGELGWAIGQQAAARLRLQPHRYRHGGVDVVAVTTRGYWRVTGGALVVWARDEVLAEIESHRPQGIAAVATWPDDIAKWRAIHRPARIGDVREELERDYDTAEVASLPVAAAEAIDGALALVNRAHAVLDSYERERLSGTFARLRIQGVPLDADALEAHLMANGLNAKMIRQSLELSDRAQTSGRRGRRG